MVAAGADIAQQGEAGAAGARRLALPVDLAHLQRFTLGNQALEIEVLQLFAAQAPVTLDQLKRSECEKSWRIAAHTLKGSARAVGAWRVARCAERAEVLVGEPEQRRAAILGLELAIEEASRFIAAFPAVA